MKKLTVSVLALGAIGLAVSLFLMTDFMDPLLKIAGLSIDSAFGWLK